MQKIKHVVSKTISLPSKDKHSPYTPTQQSQYIPNLRANIVHKGKNTADSLE